MYKMLPSAVAMATIFLSGCSKSSNEYSRPYDGADRDPNKALMIELRSFDERMAESRLKNFVGSVRLDRSQSFDKLKNRALGANDSDAFEELSICSAFFPGAEKGVPQYALTRRLPSEIGWNKAMLSFPTSMPLIFKHDDWGFTSSDQYQKDHQRFGAFLSALSDDIELLDLTYFRVPRTFFGAFKGLSKVRSMAMPWGGVDLVNNRFEYPSNLEEITLYNSRINGLFSDSSSDLENLRKIVLSGCWIDADFSYPPFAAPADLEKSIVSFPFANISHQIEAIDFVNCDNRSPLSMLYSRWDKLKSISIQRSFQYPRQDGIEFLDYTIIMILNNYINNFPNLEKITLGFHDMHQMVDVRIPEEENARAVKRWIEIRQRLEVVARNASVHVEVLGLE